MGAGEAFIHTCLQVFPPRRDSNLLNCSYANVMLMKRQRTPGPSLGKVKGGLIPQVSLWPGLSFSSPKEVQMMVV